MFTFMWGRCQVIYGSMYTVARSYTSFPLDINPHSIQPYYLRSSSLTHSLYFRVHRPSTCVVLLFSHYMPTPLQSPFLDFRWDFVHFCCPFIFSFIILASFVTPHIHRSIRICAASSFCSCAFFSAHVSAPCASSGLITVLHTFPFIFFLSHNSSSTLSLFFQPMWTLRMDSASSSPSYAIVDTRYLNVFILFTKFALPGLFSTSSSLRSSSSLLVLYSTRLPAYSKGLFFDAPSHHIQCHFIQVGAQWGSLVLSNSSCYRASNTGLALCGWQPSRKIIFIIFISIYILIN